MCIKEHNHLTSENKNLIYLYMLGFANKLSSNIEEPEFNSDLEEKAYNLGKSDACWGGENLKIDTQTNEEILQKIKR